MWAALGLGLVLACGSNDNEADDDDGSSSGDAETSSGASSSSSSSGAAVSSSSSGGPTANADAQLVVRAAYERTTLGARTLRNGSFFAVVEVSVKNATQSSFALSLTNFRLVVAGLETLAAPDSTELENACPVAGFLTAGATISCSVAFEISNVPERIVLASILEDGGEPLRLEAELPSFERCERCGEATCVDLRTSDEHCGACNQPVPPDARACANGKVQCDNDDYFCDGACESKHPERLRECSNVQVVELEGRDTTCAAACAPNTCIRGNAGYGIVGEWLEVACDELPPATTTSVLGGQQVSFSWLDCFCEKP